MKTNTLKIDFNSNSLVMNRSFAKAASFVGSEEYNILQNARRDYPSFAVTVRTIKRNPKKECYRGLTYEYMENYINAHDKSKMDEYKELILQSECHSIRYPHIKAWFLKQFPEIESFGKEKTEQDSSSSEKCENIENELSTKKHSEIQEAA